MASDTFTTALFLITAVIAAGVLINAIYPVVYQMSGTFSSTSHQADERLRTDMKIVTTYANATTAVVWIKNVGSSRISASEIQKADVFTGKLTDFDRLSFVAGTPAAGQWNSTIPGDTNSYWENGETLKIVAPFITSKTPAAGEMVYFQFVLPSGVMRSETFTRST
jgi:flagellar protein FlaG